MKEEIFEKHAKTMNEAKVKYRTKQKMNSKHRFTNTIQVSMIIQEIT